MFSLACQKSQDENIDQLTELQKQHADRLMHLPSINPTESGKIISRFGQVAGSSINEGIEFAVEKQTDVFATAAGKVVEAKQAATTDENLVIIDHGYGLQTKYSNLSEILVAVNQSVKRWTVIGRIKKATDQPVLLHYEVIKDGVPNDPEKYIF
jgi:murein DD-endopeptidase MepM/ murein hydrolase activator NlpD